MTVSLRPVKVQTVAIASATAPRLPVGSYPCNGTYYRPSDTPPRTAMIAAHYSADMSGHFLAERIAQRGFGFLGWNTRFRSGEELFTLEHALVDIAAGIDWLRAHGVEYIVLLGNSGGGSLMAAYQSQAATARLTGEQENLRTALSALPKAQLYISLNAHAGRAEYLTSIMDPAVVDELDPTATEPSLDMYDPANGPPYSDEFIARYRAAQTARNQRISAWAVAELNRLNANGIADRIFTVPRVWADLRFLDAAIDPSDRPVGECYAGNPAAANKGVLGMARATSLRTWLSLWSMDHSVCRAEQHLPNVAVPSLVIQTTHDVGVFPSDAQAIHDALGASDRQMLFRAGSHFLDSPTSARDDVATLMVEWLRSRGA